MLAGGSAMTGASEMVDNEIISGAMEVAGKNEFVARCDLSLWGVGLYLPMPLPFLHLC